ncbi:hypothetical protein QTN25_004355 [Entamoeba marina]
MISQLVENQDNYQVSMVCSRNNFQRFGIIQSSTNYGCSCPTDDETIIESTTFYHPDCSYNKTFLDLMPPNSSLITINAYYNWYSINLLNNDVSLTISSSNTLYLQELSERSTIDDIVNGLSSL